MEAVLVAPARYVRPELFEAITGVTKKAVERKIQSGVWIEGREWKKGPDGLVYVDMRGYEAWVEKAPGLRSVRKASA